MIIYNIYNKVRASLWTMALVMTLCSLFMVTGCTSDDVDDEEQPSGTLRLLSCSTRAGGVDENYAFSSDGAKLWLALTKSGDNSNIKYGTYTYNGSTWAPTNYIQVPGPGPYYLYGVYTPNAATCAITPSTDYATGAVLTISDLPALVKDGEDPCVVVGVQGVTDPNTTWNVTEGSFGYTGVKLNNKDNVHLLLDHLYASLSFSFTIDDEYAKLRTIKLKKLEIATPATTYDKVKLTVTVTGNSTGSSPITSVTTEKEGSASATSVVLFDKTENSDEHYILTTSMPSEPLSSACFAVFSSSEDKINSLKLKSTYDVYDRKGNKIVENRESVNALDVNALFGSTTPDRGIRQPVKLKVNPTYLYILSDPDLDNPTITISN